MYIIDCDLYDLIYKYFTCPLAFYFTVYCCLLGKSFYPYVLKHQFFFQN